MKRFVAILVGASLSVVLTVGVALAAIPDGGGVIHGCYSANGAKMKGGTALNILDTAFNVCSNGQAAVAWNQTGPKGDKGDKGDQGIQGVKGDTGPQGPAGSGPSTAYSDDSGLDPIPVSIGVEVTPVSIDVPAGSYVINAKVLVGNRSAANDQEAGCTLRFAASGLIDSTDTRLFGGAPATSGSFTTLPLSGTFTTATGDTIRVICTNTSTDGFIQYAQLNAILVSTVVATP
jgi:hypothetical protein